MLDSAVVELNKPGVSFELPQFEFDVKYLENRFLDVGSTCASKDACSHGPSIGSRFYDSYDKFLFSLNEIDYLQVDVGKNVFINDNSFVIENYFGNNVKSDNCGCNDCDDYINKSTSTFEQLYLNFTAQTMGFYYQKTGVGADPEIGIDYEIDQGKQLEDPCGNYKYRQKLIAMTWGTCLVDVGVICALSPLNFYPCFVEGKIICFGIISDMIESNDKMYPKCAGQNQKYYIYPWLDQGEIGYISQEIISKF